MIEKDTFSSPCPEWLAVFSPRVPLLGLSRPVCWLLVAVTQLSAAAAAAGRRRRGCGLGHPAVQAGAPIA